MQQCVGFIDIGCKFPHPASSQITGIGILLKTMRPLILCEYELSAIPPPFSFTTDIGSLRASRILYEQLLESVLFAQIRFHDTVSRGREFDRHVATSRH
jgi:hypothetical protein